MSNSNNPLTDKIHIACYQENGKRYFSWSLGENPDEVAENASNMMFSLCEGLKAFWPDVHYKCYDKETVYFDTAFTDEEGESK